MAQQKQIVLQSTCLPEDIACKSLFLGPQSENQDWLKLQVQNILDHWIGWRQKKAPKEGKRSITEQDQGTPEFLALQKKAEFEIKKILHDFEDEIPKHLPTYVGHMFSEISMPALLGQLITLCHNPNNISVESSTVGTRLETEALQEMSHEIGFSFGQGHFTSCGTIANFEFLVRARERWAQWVSAELILRAHKRVHFAKIDWDSFCQIRDHYGADTLKEWSPLEDPCSFKEKVKGHLDMDFKSPVLLVSGGLHYSWPKAMSLMGLGAANLRTIPLDKNGRMSVSDLKQMLENLRSERRGILGLVAISGSTELGAVDPLPEICDLLEEIQGQYGETIWLHVDGAYGGYFSSIAQSEISSTLSENLKSKLKCLSRVDSMTVDPHKLGYVPYSSGAFLCRDVRDYHLGGHWGPYLQLAPEDRGPYTLEGSRSAAGAVGTLLTLRAFRPMDGYPRLLSRTMKIKNDLEKLLKVHFKDIYIPEGCETNILCFAFRGRAKTLKSMNKMNEDLYVSLQKESSFTFSKTRLLDTKYLNLIRNSCEELDLEQDDSDLFLIRMTLMNPFLQTQSGDPHFETLVQELKNFLKTS